jgi:hypothetical protein
VALSIVVGAAIVDVSPFSTIGALCVAAHRQAPIADACSGNWSRGAVDDGRRTAGAPARACLHR